MLWAATRINWIPPVCTGSIAAGARPNTTLNLFLSTLNHLFDIFKIPVNTLVLTNRQ